MAAMLTTRLRCSLGVFAIVALVAPSGVLRAADAILAVRCGRLIDGRTDTVLSNAVFGTLFPN